MDLATVWFLLVCLLLTGYAILDGFDLGVGVMSLFARNEDERGLHINAIGPVWDGNEVWLLTGGGALFAAFPAVYATVFEGFYLALMLVLTALIARAVAVEFRNKVEAPGWRRTWDWVFGLSSLVAALLLGVALGNILRGLPIGPKGSWEGSFLGLLNPYSLLAGVTGLSLLTLHGALWMRMKTDGDLSERMRRAAMGLLGVFVVLFAIAYAWTIADSPLWADASGAKRQIRLHVFYPIFVLGAVGTLLTALMKNGRRRAFAASVWLVAVVMIFAAISLYPALAPSRIDPAHSLTVDNAASSPLTLKTMLVIALIGMPLVIAYQTVIYRVFRGRITEAYGHE